MKLAKLFSWQTFLCIQYKNLQGELRLNLDENFCLRWSSSSNALYLNSVPIPDSVLKDMSNFSDKFHKIAQSIQ